MSQVASIDQRIVKLVTKAADTGIMPGELQQRLGVGSATITRHLRDLEANRKVVRPTPKGPVYAPEFTPAASNHKATPGKPRRPRSQARRADEADTLSRALNWIGEHKVITGGFGLAMALGLSRPDRVRRLTSRSMSMLLATGPDGANLVEKMQTVIQTVAVKQMADALSPEELKAGYAREHQRVAENYAQSWNVRLQELERARGVMHRLIYEGSPEEQAHFFLAAGVLLPEPGGPGGLGLRRAWMPGPKFPDEARREVAPAGSMVTVEHFPRLLTIIAAELNERIRQHRVEPIPIKPPSSPTTTDPKILAWQANQPQRPGQLALPGRVRKGGRPSAAKRASPFVVGDPSQGRSVLLPGRAPKPAADAVPVRTFLSGYGRVTQFSDGSIRPES